MRDEFPKAVAETLAERVGNRCSNPGCRKPTSGPHTEDEKALNVGVAAHITAASPRGPRYDTSLTTDERKGVGNGIWLCQSCAKLVDNDEARYTKELLLRWKQAAEQEALREDLIQWLRRAFAVGLDTESIAALFSNTLHLLQKEESTPTT